MQVFKGDVTERKFFDSFQPVAGSIGEDIDTFFDEAFSTAVLGDLLFNTRRTPLSNAIKSEVFRLAFTEIFTQAFVQVGTFEAYIAVFKKIFGDDVDIQFTVPAPGKLNIEITATDVTLLDFVAREIIDNAYVFDGVITQDGDQIVFQSILGLESQYEVEVMLFEMVPAGIFTTIALTIGA